MPRDMFGDVVDPSIRVGGQKWYTVPLSILVHTVLIAAIIIIPLLAVDAPPRSAVDDGLRRGAAAAAAAAASASATRRRQSNSRWRRPTSTRTPRRSRRPKEIKAESSIDAGFEGVRRRCRRRRGRRRRRRRRGRPAGSPAAATASVGARCGSAATSSRPTKTRDVRPQYPPIAQSARVQGIVIIEATIGPNGRVQEAKVLRSIPLLDQAALDAVRQWEFTPTLLNGVPVPVIMTVTVQFTLQ